MFDLFLHPLLGWVGATVAGTVAAYAAVATAAVGTYLSYDASQQQAKQSKMNAAAQSNAIAAEQARQQLENEQAQQRTAMNQRRFRAQQEAALGANGLIGTTGSALDIIADTHAAQQRDLADIGYKNSTNNWQLQAQSNAAISQGNSQASAIMGQAGGTLLSNAGSTVSSYRSYSKK
jgi:pyruvate/2-oxoglutarate dehydrogenase complex dihydrolipoamide acyltransferase (E2) component